MSVQRAIFDLIGMILATWACLVFVTILIATFVEMVDWFTGRTTLYRADADNIAVTVAKHWEEGNYHTVQGIFNTRTKSVVDGRTVRSQHVDSDLKEYHGDKPMVVYE